jgi:signal transduction histidine kinase
MPARIEITAFRIIQEALTNVARHANAHEVSVEMWIEDGRLHLSIEDDGKGFDDANVSRSSSGLTGMHERAKLAGGELRLDSRVGGGTRLTAEIPLVGGEAPV